MFHQTCIRTVSVLAVFFTLGCSQVHNTAESKDVLSSSGSHAATLIECKAVLNSLINDATSNNKGITEVSGHGNCAVNVSFASTANMLRFIDKRLSAGLAPTVTVVRSSGRLVNVFLMLEVIGGIETLGTGQGSTPIPATDDSVLMRLIQQLNARVKPLGILPPIHIGLCAFSGTNTRETDFEHSRS